MLNARFAQRASRAAVTVWWRVVPAAMALMVIVLPAVFAQEGISISTGEAVRNNVPTEGAPAAELTFSGAAAQAETGEPRTALGRWMRDRQQELTRSLSSTLRRVQRGEADGTLRLIVGIAFLYGVIHSLLPGHRKALLFSFFMAEDARLITGVMAGTALAAVHAGAAVALVFTAYYLLQSSLSASVAETSATVQTFSAIMVLLTGSVLTVMKVREARSHASHDHAGHDHTSHDHAGHDHASHDHAGHDEAVRHAHHSAAGRGERSRRLLPVIIVSGIVPCPGSTMILLFAVSLGVIRLGLLAVVSFAAGMAVALSALAVATILVKERINTVLESRGGHTAHHAIEIGSALFMVVFGIFLLAPLVL